MERKINSRLFLVSMLIPILSILIFPPTKSISAKIPTYLLGFPVSFVSYRSYDGFLSNKFLLLLPREWHKVQVDLGIYLISVAIVYIAFALFIKIMRKK